MSSAMIWAGRILRGLIVAFLLFDSAVKLLQLALAVEPTVRLGYPASLVLAIGIVGLACTIIYMIPSTAVPGAILLTGYLGGATATQVRVGGGFMFPVVIGVMIWAEVMLFEPRLRELIPIRR